ncbi:uncharacterized protein PHALS_05733 [Plasmopara halstedii]|uniref:Uncharacterized protein n=1 Tax=Plasmopara halstedii TaxID=4781 RepID=A0A0P1AB39_PLAHL|nr:uncharacterized protein PHALS_05733 [Plasmopara halstedii]CEG37674.1 hypothetical protein PHALS_05733 [Plasmopara halstedii]|eukprot:XP_024574043.1 hypothetical protein PHALS_05733 [Plasmopara halstedii]
MSAEDLMRCMANAMGQMTTSWQQALSQQYKSMERSMGKQQEDMMRQMEGMQDAIMRAHASQVELREHQASVILSQWNEDIRCVKSEVVHKESAAQERGRAP